MGKKLICLEFNELCAPLLSTWMAKGLLPNFKRFHDASQVFTAVADEPGPDNLEPWIQWYSMHTGMPYEAHGVQNLTDGPTAGFPDVWQILANEGYRVADFASMNVKAFHNPGSLFIPDPWCATQAPFPAQWSAYHEAIGHLVRTSSDAAGTRVPVDTLVRFLGFLISNGLRPKTVLKLVGQVLSDSTVAKDTKWRRAALLDLIQFDVFRKYWRGSQPDFASFFLNSTAHYQHAYWHYAFPNEYPDAPTGEDAKMLGSAVLYGYQQMDKLLAEMFELESQGATLMLCTALSQQRLPHAQQVFYKFADPAAFLARAGLTPVETLPVMSEQVNVRMASAQQATAARATLNLLTIDGKQALFVGQSNPDSVFFGANTRTAIPDEAQISGFHDGGRMRFGDTFSRLPTTKATTHHPESLIWIKTGSHAVHQQKVSILDWLPTVLDWFSVPPAKHPATGGRSFSRALAGHLDVPGRQGVA
jgi:hypothetical protein